MPRRRLVLTAVILLACVAAALLAASQFIAAQAEARFPPVGRFVDAEGANLHVVERPGPQDAPTVLLLHGASSNHADLLAALEPPLAGRFRLIAPDRPGHGWSERGGEDGAKPARQAQMMFALLDQLAAGPVVIVAHSLAGGVAMEMALGAPQRVKGVVLLGAVTHPWPGGIAWYYGPAAHPWLGPVFNRLVAIPAGRAMLERAAAAVFAPSPMPADYLEKGRIELLFRPKNFRANAQDVQALHEAVTALSPRYGELQMPIVAFHGMGDSVTWASLHSEPLPRKAANARFLPMPGVGHMPHHADPAAVAAAIAELAGGAVAAR